MTRRPIRKLALALVGYVVPVSLFGQELRTATLTENLSRTSIRSPAIAPNALTVAYLQRETHWRENEFIWQLWLVNVSTGKSIQLTRGRKSVGPAKWSPDGRWIAFVTDRESSTVEALPASQKEITSKDGGKPEGADGMKPASKQIWMMPPDGGEAWQLSKSETDVEEFQWTKDGKSILFTAKAPPTKASKVREERYSVYEVIEKDYDQKQLWLVDAAAAMRVGGPLPATQLTFDPMLNVNSFVSSPDSTRVAFSATHNPLLAFSGDEDIYLLDLAHDNFIRKIVGLPGPDTTPMFSADGTQVAFVTTLAQPNYYYADRHIALVDLATALARPAVAPHDLRDLTSTFDEDPLPIGWASSGLYFSATQKMCSQLFTLDPLTTRVRQITMGESWILNDASLTPDGKTVAFIAEDPTHLTELYVSATGAFAPKRLTDITAQVRDWKLGSVEVVSWRSRDGALIEGVLHKPADYDSTRKYPLLVKIHGGPTSISQPRLLPAADAYPIQAFLAKGALVLEPNYRGSAGYGSAFRSLNVRNLGVGDMWDVMSGIDSLIAKGIVDPNRLAAMGWSQGGYISAFLTTHTSRFKAISVGAGVSDWVIYYASTDVAPFTTQYLRATPWDDPHVYAKTSPITTIRQSRTPTLIQHGSVDRRVPVTGAFELYRGLLDQHVDARLILYTGFGHGIDKPKSALALEQANLDWFSHYLWNEPIPKDSALNGNSELEVAEGDR